MRQINALTECGAPGRNGGPAPPRVAPGSGSGRGPAARPTGRHRGPPTASDTRATATRVRGPPAPASGDARRPAGGR